MIPIISYEWSLFLFYDKNIHIKKNIFYYLFKLNRVWEIGILIFINIHNIFIFINYVLLWDQISHWDAIIITNLLSAISYIKGIIVLNWIWDGFSINWIKH